MQFVGSLFYRVRIRYISFFGGKIENNQIGVKMQNDLSGAERFQKYIGRVSEGLYAANLMVAQDCSIDFDQLAPKEVEKLCRDTAMVAAGLYHWASILQDKLDDLKNP